LNVARTSSQHFFLFLRLLLSSIFFLYVALFHKIALPVSLAAAAAATAAASSFSSRNPFLFCF